jgi:hypothetical protein
MTDADTYTDVPNEPNGKESTMSRQSWENLGLHDSLFQTPSYIPMLSNAATVFACLAQGEKERRTSAVADAPIKHQFPTETPTLLLGIQFLISQ